MPGQADITCHYIQIKYTRIALVFCNHYKPRTSRIQICSIAFRMDIPPPIWKSNILLFWLIPTPLYVRSGIRTSKLDHKRSLYPLRHQHRSIIVEINVSFILSILLLNARTMTNAFQDHVRNCNLQIGLLKSLNNSILRNIAPDKRHQNAELSRSQITWSSASKG